MLKFVLKMLRKEHFMSLMKRILPKRSFQLQGERDKRSIKCFLVKASHVREITKLQVSTRKKRGNMRIVILILCLRLKCNIVSSITATYHHKVQILYAVH